MPAPIAPLYPVTGRVIDNRTSQPIAGASVTLSSQCELPPVDGQPERKAWSEQVTSDDEGGFRFGAVPAMTASLSASLDGYQSADDPFALYRLSPTTSPITLRLAALPSISGVVRGADGSPMANVEVLLIACNVEAGWPMKTLNGAFRTGADGSWIFPHRTPGRWELIASLPRSSEPPRRDEQGRYVGFVPVRYPKLSSDGPRSYLQLSEGQQATVDVELREQVLHRIRGTTNVPAMPLVSVEDSNGAEEYIVRYTGPQFRDFEAWVPTGRFWLKSDFSGGNGDYIGSLPVEVSDADMEGVEIPVLPRSRVTIPIEISAAFPDQIGLVRQVETVRVYRLEPNGYVRPGDASTMTGWMRNSGAKRMETIAAIPGSYAIALAGGTRAYVQSISRGGTDLLQEPLVIKPGVEQEAIHLVVAEGANIEGVIRSAGNPVRGWIYAIPEHPDGRLRQWVQSDVAGKFRVEGLAPAEYLLFASEVPVPLDGQIASELPGRWQQVGRHVALQGGRTTPVDLDVTQP